MKVREHVPAPNGKWCLFCGAPCGQHTGDFGGVSCVEREDGQDPRALRPEPKRREIACEDAAMVQARIIWLRSEAAEAQRILACAVMRGGKQMACEVCSPEGGAPTDCIVCTVKRSQPVRDCLYCWRPGQSSLPCPTRL